MVDVTIGAAGAIQPAEVEDVELYHPKSWCDEICLLPGRQSHRHPVFAHGDRRSDWWRWCCRG